MSSMPTHHCITSTHAQPQCECIRKHHCPEKMTARETRERWLNCAMDPICVCIRVCVCDALLVGVCNSDFFGKNPLTSKPRPDRRLYHAISGRKQKHIMCGTGSSLLLGWCPCHACSIEGGSWPCRMRIWDLACGWCHYYSECVVYGCVCICELIMLTCLKSNKF